MKITFEKIETGEQLVFSDKFDEEYILAHIDFGTVNGKFNSTQFIDLVGSNIDSTALEERDVYIKGCILADTPEEMFEKKRKLKSFFNPQFDIKSIYNKHSLVFRPTKTVKDDSDWRKKTDRFYLFHIYGIAHYPLWRLLKGTIIQESKTRGGFIFPLVIPKNKGITFGYNPAIAPHNIPNFGDVAVGFKLKIKAEYGEVTNPKIINNKTDEEIEVNISMASGDIVEISTENGNKYAKLIRNDVETDIFDLITLKSRMSMRMGIGINSFSITAAGNSANMTISIEYSPGYLEVV